MLASKYRLKKKINFARVEIDGVMRQSKSFGMGIFNRKDEDNSRFGFIISTKISKKAVARNRIKRIIAEVVRKNLNKIKKSLDVVFLIKPVAIKTDKIELEKETNEIITKNLQIDTVPHL
jgi:ribonuclease P protein component